MLMQKCAGCKVTPQTDLQLQQRRQQGHQAGGQGGPLAKAQRLDGKLQREAEVLRRRHLQPVVRTVFKTLVNSVSC